MIIIPKSHLTVKDFLFRFFFQLMEKLRQDIFSMFPSSSKSSSSYSVPVVTYKPNTPAYETPSYNEPEPSYNAPEASYNAPSASYETYSPPTSGLFQVEGKPHVSI